MTGHSSSSERHQCEAQSAAGHACVRLANRFEDGRWVCGTHSAEASTRRAARRQPERKKPSGAYWRARRTQLPTAPLRAALRLILECRLCGGSGTTLTAEGPAHCECRTRAIALVEQYRCEQRESRRQVVREYRERSRHLRAKLLPGAPRAPDHYDHLILDWSEEASENGTWWLEGWDEEEDDNLTDEEWEKRDAEWEAYDQAWEEWRASIGDQRFRDALRLLHEGTDRLAEWRDGAHRLRVRALQRKYEPTD